MTTEKNYKSCIADCTACSYQCMQCANACMQEDDVKNLLHCIALNNDCAAICELVVKYMLVGSVFASQLCKLCAEVCNVCAAECEKHAHMRHCADCASACRACAKLCLEMIK